MPMYLLNTIYCHVVIGLMHIMESALVMHIASIVILTTQFILGEEQQNINIYIIVHLLEDACHFFTD